MQELSIFISKHMGLTYILAALFLLLVIVEVLRLKQNKVGVDIKKAVDLINRENAAVIDLRSKEAYSQGHIVESTAIAPSDVLATPQKVERFKGRPVILVDGNGQESQKVATVMIKAGYNVYMLSGGIRAWKEANMPLVKN